MFQHTGSPAIVERYRFSVCINCIARHVFYHPNKIVSIKVAVVKEDGWMDCFPNSAARLVLYKSNAQEQKPVVSLDILRFLLFTFDRSDVGKQVCSKSSS